MLAVTGIAADATRHADFRSAVPFMGISFAYFHPPSALPATTATEFLGAATEQPFAASVATLRDGAGEWTSDRHALTADGSQVTSRIHAADVGRLRVLCTYDTSQYTSFAADLLMVNGALLGTTEHDTFSLDPANCHENWRRSEDYKPASLLAVHRGAVHPGGLLIRGTKDGRLLAYDVATGKRVWQAPIASLTPGRSASAAANSWGGLRFVANAGADRKAVQGRMYALDRSTGKIICEFHVVPRIAVDSIHGLPSPTSPNRSVWNDARRSLVTDGAALTSLAPDSHPVALYTAAGRAGPEIATGPGTSVSFNGGSGEVFGDLRIAYRTPIDRLRLGMHDWNAPIRIDTLADGDKGGDFYAPDVANGHRRWGHEIGRAIVGGVITYSATGVQKIAVTTGFASILWPTSPATVKVVILELREAAASS